MITETVVRVAADVDADVGHTAQQLHQHRPQSPRHFFEKLYGHRETIGSGDRSACTVGVGSSLSTTPDALNAERTASRSAGRPLLHNVVHTPAVSPTSSSRSSSTASEEAGGRSTADYSDAR